MVVVGGDGDGGGDLAKGILIIVLDVGASLRKELLTKLTQLVKLILSRQGGRPEKKLPNLTI